MTTYTSAPVTSDSSCAFPKKLELRFRNFSRKARIKSEANIIDHILEEAAGRHRSLSRSYSRNLKDLGLGLFPPFHQYSSFKS